MLRHKKGFANNCIYMYIYTHVHCIYTVSIIHAACKLLYDRNYGGDPEEVRQGLRKNVITMEEYCGPIQFSV